MNQQNPLAKNFRPPAISLLYCGGWSFVTHELFYMGQQGLEWGTFASCFTGGVAIGQLVKALNDHKRLKDIRRKIKGLKQAAKNYGSARFAVEEDIANAPFLSDRKGIFLGQFVGANGKARDVYFDGENSISIIAPAGENKTMSIVIPTLLSNPGQNLIIHDPAAECFSISRAALEKAGYQCIVLTPFAEKVSKLIGQKVVDAGIDIFSSLDPEMSPASVRTQLEAIVRWILPDKPNMNEKDNFFYRSARMICMFLAMKELAEGRKPTLSNLRKHLMNGPAKIQELFVEAEGSQAFGGVLAELADSLQGVLMAAPQQFAGSYGVAEQALDIYDHFSEMSGHTSGSEFDPRTLKDPNKKIAVFVIYTLDMMKTYAQAISMTMTYLFDTIASDNQSGSVTAVIDECGALQMPLADSLNFYRKAGLRCVMIWQDMAGQAEKNYGKATLKQFLAASKLKIGIGLQEPETLEMFSKLCGTRKASSLSLNDRSTIDDALPDLAANVGVHSIPLLRPEDVRMMDRNTMLIVGGNIQPIKLQKVCYWERRRWRKIAGPSPYYRG